MSVEDAWVEHDLVEDKKIGIGLIDPYWSLGFENDFVIEAYFESFGFVDLEFGLVVVSMRN